MVNFLQTLISNVSVLFYMFKPIHNNINNNAGTPSIKVSAED